MGALCNFWENELIDHLFRARSYTAPTALWVALHTADPTETGAVAEVSTTDTGYARVNLAPLFSNWEGTGGEVTAVDSAGTGAHTQNAVQITFPTPTGGTNWGTITHFSIHSAQTTGDAYIYGTVTPNKTVNQGDPAPYFAVGDLDFTLDS